MSTPITPGPWRYAKSNRSNRKYVFAAEGEVVRALSTVGRRRAKPAEREANARLIAAAPDMYAALDFTHSAMTSALVSGDVNSPSMQKARQAIRAAIAKAEAAE